MNRGMSMRYYANGKLLLSGEYLVLRGARALVVPLRLGQFMEVEVLADQIDPWIDWKAWVMERDWFCARISLPGMKVITTTDQAIAIRLVELMKALRRLKADLFDNPTGYKITTHSSFDHAWGLGSSSALIANISQWAKVDPFELYALVSSGSGYDVAAALAKGPILYKKTNQRVKITPVTFLPTFRHKIYFAYLGNKKNTVEGLDFFNRNVVTSTRDIETVDRITLKMLGANTSGDFMHLMAEHEAFMSFLLVSKRVKDLYFHDFEGEIKSLGAWGGDFVMVASDRPADYVRSYFTKRAIDVLFAFDELLLI